jgi:hypothetical protein
VAKRRKIVALPPFDDPKLAEECMARCAYFGEPACYNVEPGCKPCSDCLKACGITDIEPFDEDAAMGRLI